MTKGAYLVPPEWKRALTTSLGMREMTEDEKLAYQAIIKAEQRQLALAAHAH